MCLEIRRQYPTPNLTKVTYKVFAEVDGKLYSPFFGATFGSKGDWEFDTNRWIQYIEYPNSPSIGFYSFARQKDAYRFLDLHYLGIHAWNFIEDTTKFVIKKVLVTDISHYGYMIHSDRAGYMWKTYISKKIFVGKV